MKKFLFSILFILTAFTGYHLYSVGLPAGDNFSSSKKFSAQQINAPQWHPQNLERHWGKHRSEFPEYKTAEEYGNAALQFFRSPPKGTLKKIRSNGDRLYYHPPTNNFGVTTKKGIPKTFFRPNRGMNYWKRQKGQERK